MPLDAASWVGVGRMIARLGAVLLAAALLMSGLTGCFGHSSDGSQGARDETGRADRAVPALELRTRVTRVIGELPPPARERLARTIDTVVGHYLRAAFLVPGSGSTRTPVKDRFPGFTQGARAQAEHDRRLLSNVAFTDAGRVEPRAATAYAAVLAPKGKPLGATVRTSLTLRVTSGDAVHRVEVRGRLLLTPTARGWRIFGYDLAQSDGGTGRDAG